jgi:acyl-CoA thioesterase
MESTDGPVPGGIATGTEVRRTGPGRYDAQMDRSWWIIDGPNGGFVAAVVLRAMLAEVDDPSRRPRSLHLQYLRPPAEGPTEVQVTVERCGRTVTNVSARMFAEGQLLVVGLGVLAMDRRAPVSFDEGPGLPLMQDGRPVPPPEDLPVVDVDADRAVPMRAHYELRWVLGDPPFSPRPAGAVLRARSGGWLRPSPPEPVDEVVLAAMADAWMPPLFSRVDVPLAVPTVDLTVHFRALPEDPLDHCFVEFESPLASGGYLVEHGRVLSRDGRLLAESRQLAVVA